MQKRNILIAFLLPFFIGHAQTSQELKGTVIGTAFSVDYNTGYGSTTVNTKNNAFDNDLNTFFAAYERSGGWAGLDLGSSHVITKIACASRVSQASRLVLGIFEGANEPDFGDAIPLLIIKETPSDNSLVNYTVDCSRGFRYVRYVGPNDARCNVAEIKFYGYESSGDNSKFYQLTNLPVVSIHTVNAVDITSKDYYLKGIVSIISANGTKILTDSLNVRGRGNGSWTFPKKPYRMKLYNSTTVLDYPAKAKNWTLINNYSDKTLMRNLVAFEVSRRFNMPYTPAGSPVDVILNGEYKGCYQLCDQVEVKKKRVTITEMEPEDIALPELSGGYMIEIDAYADQETSKFYSAKNAIPVTIKSPDDDDIVSAQSAYIEQYFNKLETALYATTYNDPVNGFRSLLDTETFLKHFLIGEFCGNTDSYWSVYMTKERNDDKFKTGPVWDFDLAFENDNRTYPINSQSDYIFRTKGSYATGMRDFASRIINVSAEDLQAIWSNARNNGDLNAESLNEYITQQAELINESQKLNFMRWPIMNTYVQFNPRIFGSYDGEVKNIKDYITNRIKWMDDKVGLVTSVSATAASSGKIYPADGGINVVGFSDNATVRVFDLTGRLIAKADTGSGLTINCNQGAYIVTVDDNGSICQQKVLVR